MANKVGAESEEELGTGDAQIASESDPQSETTLDVEPTQHALEDKSHFKIKSLFRACGKKHEQVQEFYSKHKKIIHRVIRIVFLTGYFCMVIAACILNFQRALGLLILTLIAIFFYFWDTLITKYGDTIAEFISSHSKFIKQKWILFKILLYMVLLVVIILWLILDTASQSTNQLISVIGLLLFILFLFIFSKRPKKIFLNYADAGSKFLFGATYTDHFFAFKVLPIVIFFSTTISILYFLGFVQWLILKIGWIMQISMDTSPTESLVAAGNIFVGQAESPLLIRPYISDLTKSEIHSVMTSGFATIAGSVLGAYVSFGIPAAHLLTASVMSAPAALAVAKLFWPEEEVPKITTKTNLKLDKGEAKNIIEAACLGAFASIGLVANIAVNLIAFLALLAFLNAVLSWLGNMFDEPRLSFELICSYVFMPLAFIMGIDWNDSFMVGELLGVKTFFNEFVAYEKLSSLIAKRIEGNLEYVDGLKQYLSARSEAIATYALCGFANFGSVGVVIGGLSSLAPERLHDIASVSIRALIAGTVASFMTACIAALLSLIPRISTWEDSTQTHHLRVAAK
ncbi:solute carrier family 28 member 3-like isoform X6 [Rhincodon typus]|uniref:solute carrier family 28 member 3-like isoform X6 n=1 Tax=Rhincodon typus TaxID=259920 RepID=UPI00202F36A3|nr:solute carrier family 28 member 3-like isoform X6 [Rhincodon typus]